MFDYPRFNPLVGRRSLWLREYADTSEANTPNIIGTMQTYGFDCLSLKVMDGTTFVGVYDPLTPITDYNSLAATRDAYAAQGIAFLPVVVPRGVAGEYEVHATIASICGCLMVDMENGPGFWDKSPLSGIVPYWQQLREASGDAYLINEPDPRAFTLTVAPVAPYCDAVAGQHYVGWSSIGWTNVSGEVQSYERVRSLGKDTYVTLWGEERIDLAIDFWHDISQEAGGFCVFAMGSMNIQELTDFGGLTVSGTPQPIPGTTSPPDPTPPTDSGPDVTDAQAIFLSIRREVAGIRQALATASSGLDTIDTLAEHGTEDLNSLSTPVQETPVKVPRFTVGESHAIGAGLVMLLTLGLAFLGAVVNHQLAIPPQYYIYIAIASPIVTSYVTYLIHGLQTGDWQQAEMERRAKWDKMREEHIMKRGK